MGSKPKGDNLTLNDVKDAAKAKANPNSKNLAKVAKDPRLRKQAKNMDKLVNHPEKALKQGANKANAKDVNNDNKFDPRNSENGQSFNPGDTLDQNSRNPLSSKDGQNPLSGPDNRNSLSDPGDLNSLSNSSDQNPLDKFDQDKDNNDQFSQDKDNDDQNKNQTDRDKDKKDKDDRDKDKKGNSRDKDKQDKDKKNKKSNSENSAARNATIVRRKPNNRRKKINSAALKQGAKLAGKDGSKLFALNKAATFYGRYLAPVVNALRTRFTNMGIWFKNIGNTIGKWFSGATKALSGGLNAMMGVFGVTMAASTASMISSLAIILMLIFTPLILVYFYLLTIDDNAVNKLVNYTECVVKKAVNDDSDDSDDVGGGSSSGSAGATTLAYLKKHDISAKMYASPMNTATWYKTAYSISKAAHKITGLKTGLIFAQLAHECGGRWSYAAKTDNNFGGVTYTGDNKAYGGTKGSVRAEGGNYVHFKNINGYVCEYADTLMEISNPPGDKKTHIAELKKITTTKQFNDYLYLHKYYAHEAGSKERYLNGLNNWLNAYNSYVKNGYKVPNSTGSAKITAVDYEPDSDSDSDSSSGSSIDCKMETSNNTEASRAAIVKEAKSWIGKFHYLKKDTPTNVRFFPDVKDLSDRSSIPADHQTDCSGFVWFVLTRVGVKVPKFYTGDMENYAKAGTNHLKKIDKEDALPGDIVIMNVGSGAGGNGHTAILTTKWRGSYSNTNIVEMGGYNEDKGDDVNTTSIEKSFKSLIDGGARITFARVTGLKKSSGGDDNGSSNSKVITKLSKKENAARKWIVQRESGGNYKAVNPGNPTVYGAYQLKRAYLAKGSDLGGDGTLSKKNQDLVGYNYMKQRYKTWTHAKEIWQSQGWW